jgi:hypothetical protein
MHSFLWESPSPNLRLPEEGWLEKRFQPRVVQRDLSHRCLTNQYYSVTARGAGFTVRRRRLFGRAWHVRRAPRAPKRADRSGNETNTCWPPLAVYPHQI